MRTEKEEALKLKKIALSIAKEIRHFWESIQKVCHLTSAYIYCRTVFNCIIFLGKSGQITNPIIVMVDPITFYSIHIRLCL